MPNHHKDKLTRAWYVHMDGESGRETVRLPRECVLQCSGQGAQDANVAHWMPRVDWVADAETIRKTLKQYGAWDAAELADNDANRTRMLWCAACDIAESDNPDKWYGETPTDVVFRIGKDHAGTFLTALLPGEPGNTDPGTCTCFSPEGGHSIASPGPHLGRLATPEEYAPLLKTMQSAPYFYNLRIVKRCSPHHYRQRRAALDRNRLTNAKPN